MNSDSEETISSRIRRKGEASSIVIVIGAFLLVAGIFFFGGIGTGNQPNIESSAATAVPAQ